jgi:hypothetical protein
MNEESKHPSIDPELEARIVALVLGEASDFEREELNRLIELRPELAAFKVRMQSVHGLLQDVGVGEFDAPAEEWKLPADKRNAVLAVIRGEATVQAVTQVVNQSAQQRGSFKRSLRWNLAQVAAFVCVVGFVGLMTWRSFVTQESASSASFSEMASVDAPHNQSPLSSGSISHYEFDAGAAVAEDGRSRSALVPDPGKSSEVALSAIQDTLNAKANLPSPNYLVDDIQYLRAGPEFKLPAEAIVQHRISKLQRLGRATPTIENGPVSIPQAVDSPELIARNDGGWSYKGLKEEDRGGDGRHDSQPNAIVDSNGRVDSARDDFDRTIVGRASPSTGNGNSDLSFAIAANVEDTVSDPAVVAIRSRSDVAARLGAIQELLSAVEGADGDGESDAPSPVVRPEFEERSVSGMTPGVADEDRVLSFADVASPEEETNGSFGFETHDVPSQASGSGQRQAQQQFRELKALKRKFSKKRMASPADGSGDDSELETLSRSEVSSNGGRGKTRATVEQPDLDAFTPSRSSAIERPAGKPAEVRGLVRLGEAGADYGRDESEKKSEESLQQRDVAVNSGKAQGNRDAYNVLTPAAVTETTAGQPPVNFSDGIVSYSVTPPWNQKEQPVELQLKSGRLGLLTGRLNGRFGDVAPILDDNSESIKRSMVRRIAPVAGLKEKTATDEAFSTFSLHVSDVSFKLAAAALGRGEWPEAAKVRIEEFVNAFDYGDPMPCKGENVSCRVEQSIHPFVQQRNLLRVSLKTAAAGRASNTPLRLTFLLDNSGSMERIDRQQTVRRAFALLTQQLTPIDQVTLISFARQPRLLADKVSGSEAGQLVRLIDELPSEGGTNIEAALQLAFEKAREQRTPSAQNRIILLTDGAVNLGNANPESLSQIVTTMRIAGIAFDAAGIRAEGLNDEVLEALTRKGDGRYYLLDSLESADDGFARQIAGALRPSAKNVKVQVEFNPKRVGRYKLLGFEKHILKKEDFRNDKVDAAEMAAAEAGVAMYQFEAKPDGEGDVGSVSVRFRDLSTGQMIENRWPIPYEADAPRPDQAAASLRIAASAALLAAKLRGEPLGETVDLQALSHLMSGLPEQHRNDNRVQQLQQMIEQARQLSEK